MQIFPLSEGSFTIDKTKVFIPFNENEHDLQQRPTGSLLVEVQPFAIKTSKDILLLDAGLGFNKNGKLQLYQNLESVGINPKDVTKVLMTHLHKDHAGGVSHEDKLSSRVDLSFTKATYYIHEKELDFAFENGFPSYITSELEELKIADNVVLLKNDKGVIDDYIYYELSGGHSPFHQVFWIKENEEIIFFGGDEAPQLQQMKHRFVAKYDFDGKKAASLREQWWEKGNGEGWQFLFYHDIKTPIYKAPGALARQPTKRG